jgi:hypothetical protein
VWAVLWFSNPTISLPGAGDYECLAPYDTVLTAADDFRGGEPPTPIHVIRERCDDAGHARFNLGPVFGALGSGSAATAGVLLVRGRRDSDAST